VRPRCYGQRRHLRKKVAPDRANAAVVAVTHPESAPRELREARGERAPPASLYCSVSHVGKSGRGSFEKGGRNDLPGCPDGYKPQRGEPSLSPASTRPRSFPEANQAPDFAMARRHDGCKELWRGADGISQPLCTTQNSLQASTPLAAPGTAASMPVHHPQRCALTARPHNFVKRRACPSYCYKMPTYSM